jgi:hypothetical protein
MAENATVNDALSALLFDEGRELVNVKFLPGDDPSLSPERLRAAVAKGLRDALAAPSAPAPHSGRRLQSLAEAF